MDNINDNFVQLSTITSSSQGFSSISIEDVYIIAIRDFSSTFDTATFTLDFLATVDYNYIPGVLNDK